MKIKSKINFGVGLLISLIVILIILGVWNISILKKDTSNILKDNYKSVIYTHNIIELVGKLDPTYLPEIDKNIILQEKNITEIGEGTLTQNLRDNYTIFNKLILEKKYSIRDSSCFYKIKEFSLAIMKLNLQSIEAKSELALQHADQAVVWLIITAIICLIIAIIVFVILPKNITNTIEELSMGIEEIFHGNYAKRLEGAKTIEFFPLIKSFNRMAEKIEIYNNSSIEKLMQQKNKFTNVLDHIVDPVLGLDENLHFLFVNTPAESILGINKGAWETTTAKALANQNDLLRLIITNIEALKTNDTVTIPTLTIYANHKEFIFKPYINIIKSNNEPNNTHFNNGYVVGFKNITDEEKIQQDKNLFLAKIAQEYKVLVTQLQEDISQMKNQGNNIPQETLSLWQEKLTYIAQITKKLQQSIQNGDN